MDFKEFVTAIYPIVKSNLRNVDPKDRWDYSYNGDPVEKQSKVTRETELRGKEVSTGGTTGAGIGGNESPRPYVNEKPEPLELTPLDEILEVLWSNITYLQYKKLLREAGVETKNYTLNEYYGDSTNFVYMVVKLGDLFDAMKASGEGRF